MGVALHLPLRRRRDATHADRRVAPRRRAALARSLERVVEDAGEPRIPLTARVPVRRDQVLDARGDIAALAGLLRDRDRPVRPEGMRLAEALLCDGEGPLYLWAEPGTLRRRVRVISEAMG
jgi:hypothetical protein